jgi:CheY-like chemotaxis protein
MERMLARLIGEDVQLTTTLSPTPGRIKVDRNQLEQALVNLVVNARDAMPTGGRLLIETSRMDADAKYISEHPDASEGQHVVISVTDSGTGMSEETSARIFEPFFTTKQRDRGTGLGLAMVYGFAKQCDGHVTVSSALGSGSTFRLVLPHVAERLTSDRTTPQYVALVTGRERILLVEDDSGVRALTRHILADCGYDVIAMGNPLEAAAIPDEQLQSISMLLTDVVMPELSGRQLADTLRTRFPDLKVLYMSGYTDDAIMRHGVLESSVQFLQKPFTPQSLSLKIREVLD